MARGRFINTSVAADIRLNDLSLQAHCAYLMAIPHLDRDGIMAGHPRVVAGKICPLRAEIGDKMAEIIDEWMAAGLVIEYSTDNGAALYFTGFQKNQNLGASYSREGKSAFPAPPGYTRNSHGLILVDDESLMTNSGLTHELVMITHARVEVKDQDQDQEEVVADSARVTEEPSATATTEPDVAQVWEKWNANMPGTKTPVIVDGVNALLTEYSAAEIIQAIDIACKRNKRTLGYVEGILSKGVYSQAPPANGAISDTEKDALRTAALLAQSSINTAKKFKGSIDPAWNQTIERAKAAGVI